MQHRYAITTRIITGIFLIFGIPSFAQHVPTELVQPAFQLSDTSYSKDFLASKKTWREDPTQRSVYSSTYRTPDGRIIIESSKKPLNYYNESGQLLHIDDAIITRGNEVVMPNQPYPVALSTTGVITLASGKKEALSFGQHVRINTIPCTLNLERNEQGKFSSPTGIAGISKEFELRENATKYHYILEQQPAITSNYLVIEEEFEVPANSRVELDNTRRKEHFGYTSADVIITNAEGLEIGRISAPIILDANNNWILGGYQLVPLKNGNRYLLKTLVPKSWLQDASRSYPVVIDPLVTGPTALWTGGVMPSCVIPQYNIDSIAVTLPAQISVTGFFVTSSFYADPFTTAVMADGAMQFSTTCNISQSFTVQPPAGNTPGTAYLQAFNLRSPLLCCFPQACTTRTFYLRMHLGRTIPNTGCNSTHIYYNPTTQWPFSAYVEGRTVETFGNEWSIPNTPICRDVCTVIGTAQARYGVPPYTFTHPWMQGSSTGGTPAACSYGNTNRQLTLTIPNCPLYCDTTPFIVVPPPTITDACGNVVSGLQADTLWLKPVPIVTASPSQTTTCTGEPFTITLTSCLPNTTISWYGATGTGTGTFTDTVFNTGNAPVQTYFSAYSVVNGCASDTINITVNTDPMPFADFTVAPQPGIVSQPVNFTDGSLANGGTITTWLWDLGDGDTAMTANPSHIYTAPGNYNVCLFVNTANGCSDTVCNVVEIIPAEVNAPNIFTPNGDGINDALVFQYLEFYPDNQLNVYNRWGNVIYAQNGYANNWTGDNLSEGTYYYVLNISNGQLLKGYFMLKR